MFWLYLFIWPLRLQFLQFLLFETWMDKVPFKWYVVLLRTCLQAKRLGDHHTKLVPGTGSLVINKPSEKASQINIRSKHDHFPLLEASWCLIKITNVYRRYFVFYRVGFFLVFHVVQPILTQIIYVNEHVAIETNNSSAMALFVLISFKKMHIGLLSSGFFQWLLLTVTTSGKPTTRRPDWQSVIKFSSFKNEEMSPQRCSWQRLFLRSGTLYN